MINHRNYSVIKIYADFNNLDIQGRLRLNTNGTREDLQRLNITLRNGLKLTFHDGEELSAIGEVEYAGEEHIWVAVINEIHHT